MVKSIQNEFPDYISVYYVTKKSRRGLIEKIAPEITYSVVSNTNGIFESSNPIPSFDNITYFLFDKNNLLISMHISSWYMVENSERFVSKIQSLFSSIK